MFEPKYSISPKLLENIKRIGVIIAELNRHSFDQLVLVKLERRAREVSSHSSTSIEGNPLPLTDVKRILRSRPAHIRDSEREVLNYNQALELLDTRIKTNSVQFDLSLMLLVQKIVTDGLVNPFDNGKLRQKPVFVNNPRLKKTVYWPPDHGDVPELMTNLIDFVVANKNGLDPLILAGIFHKQFVIIHPFIDGNGRTARLLTKVLLANLGLNTFNLFSFENYYNQNVSKYFEQVGVLGDYYKLRDAIDFTGWLEYFADGIIDELLRVSKLLESESASPATTLQPYHQAVLRHIEKHGFITDREYANLTDRAKPTRNQDFHKLIELGVIERHGKGKATYYKLKQ
jgi:Fic family protein